MTQLADRIEGLTGPECPECGNELLRSEDPYGVTYRCNAHDCFSLFTAEEIEPALRARGV